MRRSWPGTEAVASGARSEAVSEFLVNAFGSPDPSKAGRTVTIAEVLDRSAKDLQDSFTEDPPPPKPYY